MSTPFGGPARTAPGPADWGRPRALCYSFTCTEAVPDGRVHASLAQSVERFTRNEKVISSILIGSSGRPAHS